MARSGYTARGGRAGVVGLSLMLAACGGDDITPPQGNQGGAAGSGGSTAGSAGVGASAGSSGAGAGGDAGSAQAGSAGDGGNTQGGSAGSGGSAGASMGGTGNAGAGGTGNAGAGGAGGCEAGYADCDPGVAGCETPTSSDPDHCGGCAPCGTANVETRGCGLGLCSLICKVGFLDCNGDPFDGCETNIMGDPDHCGSCANVCGSDGVASRACNGGFCAPTCSSGRANCNNNGDDGCEVTLASNSAHCGACGHACSSANATAVSCNAGACEPTCASTHGDCSTPPSTSADNGCETDLRTPTNCGECGQSCLGGACNSGQTCDPLTLTTGLIQVRGMTVDANSVYFTATTQTVNGGTLRKVSINGGAATTLVSSLDLPLGVQVSGSYVYYAGGSLDASYIRRVGTNGSGNITLYNAGVSRGAQYIQLLGSNLYWYDNRNQHAYRMAITGGSVTKLNSSGMANITEDIATDGSYLYTIDYAKVLSRMPIAGGAITNLGAPSGYSQKMRIAVDGSHLYYLHDSQVWRVAKAGGSAERIVTHASVVSALALDGGYVYYIAADGVFRTAKSAAASEEVVWLGATSAVDAEISGGALYWVGAAAMKLAL